MTPPDSDEALIERFDIRTRGPDAPVKRLSGGNIQKVVTGEKIGSLVSA